jgi:chromosome segregation ATPase
VPGRQALSESQRLLFVAQQESAARATADATRHAEEVVAIQATSQEAAAEIAALRTKQKQLEAELAQSRAGAERATEVAAKARKSCEGAVAAAREETNKVRREACHCVAENERLHSIVDEKDRQLALLQETAETLSGQHDGAETDDATENLRQQCVVLVGQLDHSHAAHCELERRMGEMQGALQGQVLEFSALQREASALLEKLADAQQELTALRELKVSQAEQTHAARLDIASLQRELEEARQSLKFQQRRSDAAEAECAVLKRESAEQRASHFAAMKKHVAEHEGATRELKLRLLSVEHEARGVNTDKGADGDGGSLLAAVTQISTQIRESASKMQAELAAAGHPQHDQALRHEAWRARTDAQLAAYEGAIAAQARATGQLQLANAT